MLDLNMNYSIFNNYNTTGLTGNSQKWLLSNISDAIFRVASIFRWSRQTEIRCEWNSCRLLSMCTVEVLQISSYCNNSG